jgi:uncharacterized protein (DUF1778 family)
MNDTRLNFRMPLELKSTIKEAAACLGQSVSAFAVSTLAQTARSVIDSDYRRTLSKQRIASERSFAAALRRLRKQRGLTQADFAPISAKTIARIEQGKVNRVHPRTLAVLADRLAVEPDEIETF